MLFEEFVEQHRVYLIVAHGVDYAVFVADHKIRAYLLYIFSYEPKLRCTGRINLLLITERNRFK